MKMMLLSLLCLFVWTEHTGALIDQQVALGQTVTVTCEFRLKAVVWFVMKPSAHPMMIMRTFATDKATYYNENLRSKYSEGSRGQLEINDIRGDDLGVYYCVKPGMNDLMVSDGIRLNSAVISQEPEIHIPLYTTPEDQTEAEHKNLLPDQKKYQLLIGIFTSLIVVMFVIVIGLLVMNYKLFKKIPRTPKYVNGHQVFNMRFRERERRIIQTNDDRPQSRLTDHIYLDIQP